MTPALGKGFKVDAFDAEGTCGVVWVDVLVFWCTYVYVYICILYLVRLNLPPPPAHTPTTPQPQA